MLSVKKLELIGNIVLYLQVHLRRDICEISRDKWDLSEVSRDKWDLSEISRDEWDLSEISHETRNIRCNLSDV